jgi:hypothetical protein
MLQIEIDDNASPRLRELARKEIPAARRRMVTDLLRDALQRTADQNPVATGRSREAWLSALQQLGTAEAAANQEGSASVVQSEETTQADGTSHVPYVQYLEYGTRHFKPIAMVRRALQTVRQLVTQYFRLN